MVDDQAMGAARWLAAREQHAHRLQRTCTAPRASLHVSLKAPRASLSLVRACTISDSTSAGNTSHMLCFVLCDMVSRPCGHNRSGFQDSVANPHLNLLALPALIMPRCGCTCCAAAMSIPLFICIPMLFSERGIGLESWLVLASTT